MDADSSYGGSDTAHDLHSSHDDSSHLDHSQTHINSSHTNIEIPHPHEDYITITTHNQTTTAVHDMSEEPSNQFYHKNEITLPVNYGDETDFQKELHVSESEPQFLTTGSQKEPHYLSTARINVSGEGEPHSNLEETSRNFRSTNKLNETPESERRSGGIENPAFVNDTQNIKSTFNHEKPYNGDLNSSLGVCSLNKTEEPMTEAVNLELINLKPVGTNGTESYDVKNGLTTIPLKKENDRDMGNPYDEYFVPVNEHRKIMRGEKLYVTKDKRGEKGKRNCLCWSICLCLVAAAIILGILAAVGVIGKSDSTPQEVSARKLDGNEQVITKGGISVPGVGDSNNPPLTPEPPLSTVSGFLPTTEFYGNQIPRALESEFTIDNQQFSSELEDKNSAAHRVFARSLEEQIKYNLFTRDILEYGPADIDVKVTDLLPGNGVVVRYRVGWTFKDGIHNAKDPIDEESLKKRMTNKLDKNNGLMATFHVVGTSIEAQKILDLCKIENNHCEHLCMFDYHQLDFICTCPAGKHLSQNQKSCVEDTPHNFFNDIPDIEHAHVDEQFSPKSSSEPSPTPEPNAEPEPSPTPEPSPEPEPSQQPRAEPEPSAKPEPTPEPTTTPKSAPSPEPEPTSEPEPSVEPQPSEPETSPKSTTTTHDFYISHIHQFATEANTEHESTSRHMMHEANEARHFNDAAIIYEPSLTPENKSETESIHENQNSDLNVIPIYHETLTESSTTPKPEPSQDPNKEEESIYLVHNINTEIVTTTETSSMNTSTSEEVVSVSKVVEPESTAEPSPEPTAEPAASSTIKYEERSRHLYDIFAEPNTTEETEPKTTIKTEEKITEMPETSHHLNIINTESDEMKNKSMMEVQMTTETTTSTEVHVKPEVVQQNDYYYTNGILHNKEQNSTSTERTETASKSELFVNDLLVIDSTTMTDHDSTTMVNKMEKDEKLVETEEITTEKKTTNSSVHMEKMTLMPDTVVDSMDETTDSDTTTIENSEMKIVTPPALVILPKTEMKENENITADNETTTFELTTTAANDIGNTTEVEMTTLPIEKAVHEEIHIPVVIRQTSTGPEAEAENRTAKIIDNENQLFTELHRSPKIQDIHYIENSTFSNNHENISHHGTDPDHPEHGHDEYMSPFLPYLDNDTFINSLHSDEHFLEHNTVSKESEFHENSSVTKPPSLQFDQMNHTNPYDNNTSDALTVIPLKPNDTLTTTPMTTTQTMDVTTIKTDQTINERKNEVEKQNLLQHSIVGETNYTQETTETLTETVTQKPIKEEETTLPPEILNNVHSNAFFEKQFTKTVERKIVTTEPTETTTNKIIETKQEVISAVEQESKETSTFEITTMKTELEPSISRLEDVLQNKTEVKETTTQSEESVPNSTNNNFNEISSSTEDLIAVETTTNQLKTFETTNKIMFEPKEASTIHADTVETAKTVVHVLTEDENDILDHKIKTTTEDVNLTINNVVTVEKSPVSLVITTESPDEELLVEPLTKTKEVEKFLEKKEINHNLDSSETINDISSENLEKQVKKERKLSLDDVHYTTEKHSVKITISTNKPIASLPDVENIVDSQVKPVTENFELPRFSRCLQNQFQCVNGTSVKDGSYCILSTDRCDSVLDCTDGSDEVNCEAEGCPNNFQCASKQCLKRHLVCDGIINCNDGTDEVNCSNWSCLENELSCGLGERCIPLSWKCDGKAHCVDSSDERGCQINECTEDAFHCREEGKCVPPSWRCDGKSDCAEGEDEKSCECTREQFKCITGGGCISLEHRCDREAQCSDKSDEWNCFRLQTIENSTLGKEILEYQGTNNTWYPICMDPTIWNTTFADLVCQNLGHSTSSSFASYAKSEEYSGKTFYKIKPTSAALQLEKADENCDEFISLTCNQYVCGNPVQSSAPGISQWPSLSILYNKKDNIHCTASLLTPLWAVASYSCIVSNTKKVETKDWVLHAGSTDKLDNSSSQVIEIKEIVIHPQVKFTQFVFINDVVLVRLVKPVVTNENVSAICLPQEHNGQNQRCMVIGWDINRPGETSQKQYMQYLPASATDNQECNSTEYYNGKIYSRMICVDDIPCYNDKGAPLMCFDEPSSTWQLHGLLSYHDNCGKTKHPAIYTSIDPKLRLWITNTIGQQAFSRKSRDIN